MLCVVVSVMSSAVVWLLFLHFEKVPVQIQFHLELEQNPKISSSTLGTLQVVLTTSASSVKRKDGALFCERTVLLRVLNLMVL